MPLTTARAAADLLAPMFVPANLERVICVHLDKQVNVLAVEEASCGDQWSAPVPLRRIMHTALSVGATGLIMAHNHPSGEAEPSAADIAATRRLAEVGRALGLQLHDHLVFAGPHCSSFRALGLL